MKKPYNIDRAAILADKLNARKRMESATMGSVGWWSALDDLRRAESLLG